MLRRQMTNFKLAGVQIWQDGASVDGGKINGMEVQELIVNICVTANHSVSRK